MDSFMKICRRCIMKHIPLTRIRYYDEQKTSLARENGFGDFIVSRKLINLQIVTI